MRTLVFLLFYLVSNSLISQNNTPYIDYSGSINLVENQISTLSVVAFDDDVIQLIDNPHIIVLGSSTAAGTGASTENGWVWQFDEYLSGFDIPYTLTNLSVSGYNSYHFIPSGYAPPGRPNPDLTRNITHALALDPDIIVVNLPSNDVANGFSAQETYNNFHIIDSIATAQGVSVFFTTTQPRNFSNLSTRQELKIKADTILSRYGSKAISLYDELADPNFRIKSIYHSGDGIHLNDLGHTYIFRQVADILYPFLFDGDSITFSMTGNPGFAQLTDYGDRTAEIILSPGGNSAGIYDFTLTATDANNNSFDETIHLIINEFGHVGGTQALESFNYTINGGGTMDYYVYYPQNFDANPSNWPVLISLHGNAERGGSSTKLVQSEGEGSLAKLLHDGAQLPFMVISPHMSAFIGGVYQPGWNIDALEELVDHIKVEYDIDSTRIYMTGFSAGGAATWLYLVNNPDQIAAATVLAGLSNLAEGNLQQAPYPCLIKEIPIKVWHGDEDNVVNISHSTNMVNAINSCDPAPDPEVELIIPNGVGHDELRTMVHADFTSPNNMYDWFLSFSLDSVFDLKPPGFVSAPEIAAGSDFATITAEIDEPGKIYFGLYEYGSVPSVEDILTSTGSGFVDGGVSDSRFLDYTFQDLTNFTLYDAWVIAQDLANPPNLQRDPVLVQFTTFSDTLPPTMQSGPQVEVSTGAISVNFRTNEPGNVYWALLGDLDVDVASHQLQQLSVGIQHGQKSIGSNLESLEVTGLAKESTYNFLMTIDDVEGNLSDSVYQFEFTTLPVETTVGASTVINLNLINSTSSNLDEWNDINVTGFSGYKSFNNLLDEDGNETGVSFTAINGVQASSIVGVANNNSSLANGVFPDEVLQYAAYTTGGANFYFEGLDPTIEYSVQLHGGRSGSGSRLTSFTVQGESQQLECINNNTEVVTFDEVFSNGNGRIDIQFSNINSSWAYMNAIVISEMIEEIDTFPPGVPSNLSAILQGNQIMINWDDNLETDFHSYSIYITADSGLPGSGDLIVNGLSQSEYEYDPIQQINYIWVSSVDNTGNESSLSGPILISTEPIDNTPPSAPVINELTVIGIDSIYLSWTGGGEADLSGYNVYRSQSSGFPLTVANLVTTSTGTSYTDIG
ncbi:MAG: hypothetical protein KI791_07835, partial [Cyclobacteriaceae bacterium]|nr:hypothetical protein [Cyclobacteriaceae bacterium SS2]